MLFVQCLLLVVGYLVLLNLFRQQQHCYHTCDGLQKAATTCVTYIVVVVDVAGGVIRKKPNTTQQDNICYG